MKASTIFLIAMMILGIATGAKTKLNKVAKLKTTLDCLHPVFQCVEAACIGNGFDPTCWCDDDGHDPICIH
jgi:hypothetical protein